MTHYLVHYSLGANKEYVYPKSIEGIVWKSTLYHYTDWVMVGETDDTVKADGKKVIALTPNETKKHIKRLQASFPDLKDLPDPLKLISAQKK